MGARVGPAREEGKREESLVSEDCRPPEDFQ